MFLIDFFGNLIWQSKLYLDEGVWAWPMREVEDARGSEILFITCSLVGHCRKGKPPKMERVELPAFNLFITIFVSFFMRHMCQKHS